MPPHEAHSPVSLRELFRISPLGTIGMGATGATQGAFFGMGAVYGSQIGLSVAEISIFMSAMLLGGVLLQWPVGRLSDRFDRRRVITLVTLMAATFAGIASIVVAGSETHRILILFLFGAVNLPMYALCIAHTNDYLEPTQFVEASGTLVLIAGLGAAVGPLAAAAFMDLIGPHGFFLFLAGIHLSVGGFALYRMTRRAATPLEDQGDYVPLPPRATPTATAIYADVMAEAASHEPEVTPAPVPVASGS